MSKNFKLTSGLKLHILCKCVSVHYISSVTCIVWMCFFILSKLACIGTYSCRTLRANISDQLLHDNEPFLKFSHTWWRRLSLLYYRRVRVSAYGHL